MIIFLPKNKGYSLHKHPNKNESYQIIKGKIKFEIGTDLEIKEKFILSKETPIFYATNSLWHSLIAIEDYAIYIENREGPFSKDNDTVWY